MQTHISKDPDQLIQVVDLVCDQVWDLKCRSQSIFSLSGTNISRSSKNIVEIFCLQEFNKTFGPLLQVLDEVVREVLYVWCLLKSYFFL